MIDMWSTSRDISQSMYIKRGSHQRIPESLRALFKIVSLTAANTRRMLDVSVACVKLIGGQQLAQANQTEGKQRGRCLLWVEVQVSPVDLVEPPEQIFGCLVDIVATRVVWEVIPEG